MTELHCVIGSFLQTCSIAEVMLPVTALICAFAWLYGWTKL